MKKRIDMLLQRQLGRLIPVRREWFHSSSWKPRRESGWQWLGRWWFYVREWRS